MTSVQLILMRIRRVLAKKHAVGKTLDNDHLRLGRCGNTLDMLFAGMTFQGRDFAGEVIKAATMRREGGSKEARVDAMVSTPGNHLLCHTQTETLYRSANGKNIPDLSECMTTALADGSSPIACQKHVRVRLNYICRWKEDPDKVFTVMLKASREYELVEISETEMANRDSSKPRSPPAKVPKSENQSKKRGGRLSQSSIICCGSDKRDHTRRQCKKGHQRDGSGELGGGGQVGSASGGVSGRSAGQQSILVCRSVGSCSGERRFRSCWNTRQGCGLGSYRRRYYPGSILLAHPLQ